MNRMLMRYKCAPNRKYVAALCIVLCLASGFAVYAAADARKIMEGVYQQDTTHDMTMRAVLNIYSKDGQGSKKQFVLNRLGSAGDSKTVLRFTSPDEIKGVALLSINSKGATDRQWLYTPAIERVRSISPRERSEKFAGSDFTFEDIGERVLEDFTYQVIGEGEVMDNRKTYKIDAVPVAPDHSQYKHVYFWVAQDVPVIMGAEMYDQSGQKIRVMHASGLRKESGMWGARRIEMLTPAEGTRTTLTIDEIHFNTGLDEKLFTPDALATAGTNSHGKTPKAAH